MKTRLKDCLKDGRGAINGWLSVPNTFTAEIFAMQDFDSITIDLQHGLVDYQAALTMLQAMGIECDQFVDGTGPLNGLT